MRKQITKKSGNGKPAKPHKDYPLFAHANGQWAKKVRGTLHYFGLWSDPDAALQKWLDEKDDLLAGRTPGRSVVDGVTVKAVVNAFLTAKLDKVDTHEITQRHFDDLYSTCEIIVREFGKDRLVDDLRPEDFAQLRRKLAKTRAAWALSSQVTRVRSVFGYAYKAKLIERSVGFGPDFERPSENTFRREREDKPAKMMEPPDLRRLIDAAGIQLRAMNAGATGPSGDES